MISYINKPKKDEEIFKVLNPVVGKWFREKFGSFSEPQRYALLNIHNRKNTLVSAATGSGKTLTGFSSVLSELITLSENNLLENKVYCIYVSPLKSLNNDVFFNLEQPLKEMEKIAGKKLNIKVNVRTGDTTTAERQKMLKNPPHILITTPESLALMLSSIKFKELMRNVRWCIIDELHALCDNKRGVHLSLSLERLQNSCEEEITRIGLGATCEPLEEISQFLVGSERDCEIAKIDFTKKMDLKVLSSTKDLIDTTHKEMHDSLYNLLNNLIQDHKTTLIFTNTRSGTERVVHNLKEKFPGKYNDENIGAHHGSLSKTFRLNLEKRMREGNLKVICCSTSLELGIDIGFIDLVICLGSPKSIARLCQRCGRSGHKLHDTVKGRIIVLNRDDLVECSVMLKGVLENNIDRINIPKNCLDVLAQHIHGIAISNKIKVDELFKLIKRSYCYKELKRDDFIEVVNYLAGKFTSLEDRYVYAKIWYDEETGMIGKKGKLSRVIHMTNIGTIPDESFITIKIGNEVIGHIDEAFLEKLKPRDVFVLGGKVYEFLYSRGMTAQVKGSINRPPTVPSWFSEQLPLSFDLALSISKFRGHVEYLFKEKKKKEEILDFINDYLYIDRNSANALYEYFKEQFLFSEIPSDKKLLVEFFNDKNKKYVVFHSLYGRRVNEVFSRAIAYAIARIQHKDVEIGVNDNGFFIGCDKKENIQVMRAFNLIKAEELRRVLERAIESSEIFKRRFRHCATRSLMILRQYKGKRKMVGRQQMSSMLLISALRRIDENFCILKEARREVLEDLMDIKNTVRILKDIEDGKIKIKQISTLMPSPFALNLVLQGYVDVLRIEDKIEFLKKMHNMIRAKISLRR
jgi:ATP-dependent Lhr-like helicase